MLSRLNRWWSTRRIRVRRRGVVTLVVLALVAWRVHGTPGNTDTPTLRVATRSEEESTWFAHAGGVPPEEIYYLPPALVLTRSEAAATRLLETVVHAQEHTRAVSRATGGPGHFANSLDELRSLLNPQLLSRVEQDYRVSVCNALFHPRHGWQAVANPRRRWQKLKAFSVN